MEAACGNGCASVRGSPDNDDEYFWLHVTVNEMDLEFLLHFHLSNNKY